MKLQTHTLISKNQGFNNLKGKSSTLGIGEKETERDSDTNKDR